LAYISKKGIISLFDEEGFFRADAIALEDEKSIQHISHPFESGKRSSVGRDKKEKLSHLVMKQGKAIGKTRNAYQIAEYTLDRLQHLPAEHKRFVFPHTYRVGISDALLSLRDQIKERNNV